MDLIFQQSYYDTTQSKMSYGPKIIKVNKDFTQVIDKNYKTPLNFIKEVRFGNPLCYSNVASRDIESHAIFRANEFDDFVVVRRYNGEKYIFDRIDYLNIEYRPICN
jgi:hypothetical protein